MTVDQVVRAIRTVRAQDQRGCGRTGESAIEGLRALDGCATAYNTWSPLLIPAALQTSAYAAVLLKAQTPGQPWREVVQMCERRQARARALMRRIWDGECCGTIILGGTALSRPVGTVQAHSRQLLFLLNQITQHRLRVRVVSDFHTTSGVTEPYTLYDLSDGPRVAYWETSVGGWYSTRDEDTSRLYATHERLLRVALPPGDSRAEIQEVLKRCLQFGETEADVNSESPATRTPITALRSPRADQQSE